MLNAKSTARIPVGGLPFRPKTLISFWEMLAVSAMQTWAVLHSLEGFFMAAHNHVRSEGPDSRVSPPERAAILQDLEVVESLCRDIQLERSIARLTHFKSNLIENQFNNVVASEISGLRTSIMEEASDRKFAFIPTDKAVFFEHEVLFGDSVNEAF